MYLNSSLVSSDCDVTFGQDTNISFQILTYPTPQNGQYVYIQF